ncbi:hypothetical protein K7432_003821 [Basidiobolus ranarum]|uniref:Alginate lyase domain-containing protein n=1 Tax=Basidiobolus ranarum TaxID=34480 RepID=A0ABR2W5M4_9FUNG
MSSSYSQNKLLHSIVEDANECIQRNETYSVINKFNLPPSGDIHDYLSLAPYFWPDKHSEDGLPYTREDGRVNPDIEEVPDYQMARRLFSDLNTLGSAYFFTGNETYSERGLHLINIWFVNKETAMNPSLKYGSLITGKAFGRHTGILDFYPIYKLLDAVKIFRDSRSWLDQPSVGKGLRRWIKRYQKWLLNSSQGRKARKSSNNHGTYYDFQLIKISEFLHDYDKIDKILTRWENRVQEQIDSLGRQVFEMKRRNSWHYSVFNLKGEFKLLSYSRRSSFTNLKVETKLKSALDYLSSHASKDSWPIKDLSDFNKRQLIELLEMGFFLFNDERYLNQSIQFQATSEEHLRRKTLDFCHLSLVLNGNIWLC